MLLVCYVIGIAGHPEGGEGVSARADTQSDTQAVSDERADGAGAGGRAGPVHRSLLFITI